MTNKAKSAKTGKRRSSSSAKARRKGRVAEISAEAAMSTHYAGNSALVDDAIDAQQAFARADTWARSAPGTAYGSATPATRRTR